MSSRPRTWRTLLSRGAFYMVTWVYLAQPLTRFSALSLSFSLTSPPLPPCLATHGLWFARTAHFHGAPQDDAQGAQGTDPKLTQGTESAGLMRRRRRGRGFERVATVVDLPDAVPPGLPPALVRECREGRAAAAARSVARRTGVGAQGGVDGGVDAALEWLGASVERSLEETRRALLTTEGSAECQVGNRSTRPSPYRVVAYESVALAQRTATSEVERLREALLVARGGVEEGCTGRRETKRAGEFRGPVPGALAAELVELSHALEREAEGWRRSSRLGIGAV